MWDHIGEYYRRIKRDARSLDYSSEGTTCHAEALL